MNMNMLKGISPTDMHGLTWLNEPESWAGHGEGILITPKPYADFFIDPAGLHMKSDAPYLHMDIQGDFVARALVRPEFASVWDSVALLVLADGSNWAKLCFEWSDAGSGYKGIVNVVTKDTSDDANGCPITQDEVWLQVCRVGSAFAMHWSIDGEYWSMARLFGLECCDLVSIGIAGQCPGGPSATHEVKEFSVEHRSVANLRKGV